MNNLKDNKNNNQNSLEMTKKSNSLPLIVGTGAMLIAGVISFDTSMGLETSKINALSSTYYTMQDDDNENEDNLTKENGKKKNSTDEYPSYLKNSSGELFYDSSAEDDKSYYGEWDRVDHDDDDEYIFW